MITDQPHVELPNQTDKSNLLDILAEKYGTDKRILCHGYTRAYDKFFEPIRKKVKNLVEVGICDGASLKMWRDYLPNATIHGLDIDQKCVDTTKGEPRIITHLKSGCDPDYWKDLTFKPEIILDDGSHVVEEQVSMLANAWDSLAPGGYYVIEDTHSSFFDVYNTDKNKQYGFYNDIFKRILDQQAYQTLQGDWYITRDKFAHRIDRISYETFGIYSFTSLVILEKTK